MSWLGSLLGDIPIIGDAVNWLGGHYENNRNQNFQHDESAAARYWQTEESQKARDWQTRENQIARNWQAQQWQTQFGAQNAEYDRRLQQEREYNDPSSQARRLAAAGINPASMGGDQSGGTSFAAPESPSLSTPNAQSAPVASPVGYPATSIPQQPNLAQSIAALSQANLSGAQADRIYSLLEGDIYLQGIEKGMKDIEYDIASLTKDSRIMDSYYSYQEKVSRIILNDEMTYTEQKKQLLLASEEFLNYASGGLKHEEMNLLRLKIARFNEITDADLKLKRAQTHEALATAGLRGEETQTQRFKTEIERINSFVADKTKHAKIDTILKNYIAQAAESSTREEIAEFERQRIEYLKAINSENWKKADAVLSYFFSLIGLHTSVSASASVKD